MQLAPNLHKPEIWAWDYGSISEEWTDFWNDCLVCAPCWDEVGRDQNSAANTAGSSNPGMHVLPGTRLQGRLSSGRFMPGSCQGNGSGFPIPTTQICSGGKALFTPSFAATCDSLIGTVGGNDIVPANRVTMLIVRQKSAAVRTNGCITGINAAAAVNRCETNYPFTDGIIYWDFGGFSAGTTRITWNGYVLSTAVERWAFVAGPNGLAIYLDGVLRSSGGTAPAARTVGTTNFGLFNSGGLVASSDAVNILFFALLDAEWPAGRVADWASDPYGPIRMVEHPGPAAMRNPTRFGLRR